MWNWPLRKGWIGAKTLVLKEICENKCPIVTCRSDTQVRADLDSYKNVERIYQVCVKCGTEFSAVFSKRPEPKISGKQVKQMFGV